jgi:tRNA-Thr(GGU) m(6)t(6)A37 methyltransferase TsaA
VELRPEFAPGLRDLEGYDQVWLIHWFDRARSAQLGMVPYLDTQTHGSFATRLPNRPNPAGLSRVRLLAVEGSCLRVADLDVLDGAPLVDLKPYVPDYDVSLVERIGCFARARGARIADSRVAKGPESRLI